MKLREAQKHFADLMLSESTLAGAEKSLFAHSDDKELSERLSIYQNNIILSLIKSLEAAFPATKKLVGEKFFTQTARQFARKNPPGFGSLNFYGRGFDLFLSDLESAKNHPYLPDMARLEIALNCAYYAANDDALTAETLSEIGAEKLADAQVRLRSGTTLLQSPYALDKIYKYCQNPDVPPPAIKAQNKPFHFLIHRNNLETVITPLKSNEFSFLQELQSDKTFGEILGAFMEKHPDFDFAPLWTRLIDLRALRLEQRG